MPRQPKEVFPGLRYDTDPGGGGLVIVLVTATFDQLTEIAGPQAGISPFYHLLPGELLLGGVIVVREGFDDSQLMGSQPSIEDITNTVLLFAGASQDLSQADVFTDGLLIFTIGDNAAILAGPSGADLVLSCGGGGLAEDGTTGILDVYFFLVAP